MLYFLAAILEVSEPAFAADNAREPRRNADWLTAGSVSNDPRETRASQHFSLSAKNEKLIG